MVEKPMFSNSIKYQYIFTGENTEQSVFEAHYINRKLLPRGCAFITLTSCGVVGSVTNILLTSTSLWYQLKTNRTVFYTYGIIFAEINDLSIPISITGVKVISTGSNFELITGSSLYKESDGVQLSNIYKNDCLLFDITPKDIHDFISSGSFLGTVFDRFNVVLPSWLRFSKSGVGMISVTDLKTDLLYGRYVDNQEDSRGAPVLDDHLYNVFRFGTDMSFSVYGKMLSLPPPLDGNKFCFIVDICQSNGATVILMLSPESRTLLDDIDIFSTMEGSRFRPRGI
jgi:hypothetical protein